MILKKISKQIEGKMKKVLITGADGFLGRNLVKRLLLEDIYVVAVAYPGNNSLDGMDNPRLHIVCVDLNDVLQNVDIFPRDIDVMYHFAWVGVCPELRENMDVQLQNINLTMNCMKLANELGINRVVIPGSTNEYLYCGQPINKDAIPSPSNAYGSVKIAIRYIAEQYAKTNNLEYIYMIITGIYAADRKDNNVIYYTIENLLQGKQPSLTKSEQLWDYIYIDDVVDALYLVGEKGKNGAVYAVGHGDNWPLSNYINIIHGIIAPEAVLGFGKIPYNTNRLPSSCIDLSDIYKDTGFVPKTSFEDGILKVIDSVKKEMGDVDE